MSRSSVTLISASALVATVVAIPVTMVGALAVPIKQGLGFGDAQFGAAVAGYFAIGAVFAPVAGRLVGQKGTSSTTTVGLLCTTCALWGIALLSSSWGELALFLAVGGLGNTLVQLGVNVTLANGVDNQHMGVAFGVKQAAVPAAALLAGGLVSLVGASTGWNVMFVGAALVGPPVGLLLLTRLRSVPSVRGRHLLNPDAPLGSLVLLALGTSLAAAGGVAAAAFIVSSAVDRGFAVGDAALVLAIGSFVGVITRTACGWLGDRFRRGSLLLMSVLVVIGGVGYVGLAFSATPLLVVFFTVLAFGGGWGWGGLMLLALARANPGAPGKAMGIVQAGPFAGSVIGPLAFGTAAEQVGFEAAWLLMAAMAALAAVLTMMSRRLMRHTSVRRP